MNSLLVNALETLPLYRYAAASGWSDDTSWHFIQDVEVYIEPISYVNAPQNDQDFQSIYAIGYCPVEYADLIQPEDGIISAEGIHYINIGIPEKWKNIIDWFPHNFIRFYMKLKMKIKNLQRFGFET